MRLVISQRTFDRFNRSLRWYAAVLSEQQLLRLEARIAAAIMFLVDHPGAGRSEPWLEHLEKDHRRWVVGHFKIIYHVKGKTLYVTDIFDLRQHPRKMKG